ncbi:uncharacterized protein LOC120667697 [Panicum virgatum]|uniref:Uncharacterized protein n=1 Tax=Panicum virgatum TaxID=38727 RepID=A0A8T0UAX9_PANVG|nr:uncharacterized protein LOC120667697 [Panicum virgatum]KAG2619035.1 hypothetical protein PVAP13_3NG140747 [Panicum virgatum]
MWALWAAWPRELQPAASSAWFCFSLTDKYAEAIRLPPAVLPSRPASAPAAQHAAPRPPPLHRVCSCQLASRIGSRRPRRPAGGFRLLGAATACCLAASTAWALGTRRSRRPPADPLGARRGRLQGAAGPPRRLAPRPRPPCSAPTVQQQCSIEPLRIKNLVIWIGFLGIFSHLVMNRGADEAVVGREDIGADQIDSNNGGITTTTRQATSIPVRKKRYKKIDLKSFFGTTSRNSASESNSGPSTHESGFTQNLHDVVVSQNFMVELRPMSFPELALPLTRTAASFSRLCSGSRYGHRLMTLVLVPPGDRGSDGDELTRGEVNCKVLGFDSARKDRGVLFGSDDPGHNLCRSLPRITVWSQHVLLVYDLVTAHGDLLRIWDRISARSRARIGSLALARVSFRIRQSARQYKSKPKPYTIPE